MERIYEERPGGVLALADHLREGNRALLTLDKKHLRKFRVVGARSFLSNKFGPKMGMAIYRGLLKAGILKPLGFVHGRGLPAGIKEYQVIRRKIVPLKVSYREYKSGKKRRPRCKRCISVRTTSGRRAIGAILAVTNNQSTLRTKFPRTRTIPMALATQLLKLARLPVDVPPHLVELKFHFR